MKAMRDFVGQAAVLPVDNIDTDRITPARFLKTTESRGLGKALFADWPEGRRKAQDSEVLCVGNNFGCGSSREHAVWALMDAGIRVVISTSFADIFHANALRNGLVAIELEAVVNACVQESVQETPKPTVRIELCDQRLVTGSFEVDFEFDEFARHCITKGLDELGYLLGRLPDIEQFEVHHRQHVSTTEGWR